MHKPTAKEAAESLAKQFQEKSWFVTVGVQSVPDRMPPSSTLIVYVAKEHADQEHIACEWMGFHVKVVSGNPLPASC